LCILGKEGNVLDHNFSEVVVLVDSKKQIADIVDIQLDFFLQHDAPKLLEPVFE